MSTPTLTETVSTTLAANKSLSGVSSAVQAFIAAVELALPAADRTTFGVLIEAAINEVVSLANNDPTLVDKLKSDVQTVLGKIGSLFSRSTAPATSTASPSVSAPPAPSAPAPPKA